MNDAEYLFNQISAERKRIGRGDFNKKRQGGKQVRLPSDNLSRKEWEKMNGECKSYDMAKPVKWEAFKQWPADLQRSYLQGLQDEFNAKSADISAMFGISTLTLGKFAKLIGYKFKKSKAYLKANAWKAFLGEEIIGKVVAPEPPAEVLVCADEESSAIEVQEPVKVDMTDPADVRIDYLCCLLKSLKGTGTVIDLKIVI